MIILQQSCIWNISIKFITNENKITAVTIKVNDFLEYNVYVLRSNNSLVNNLFIF